MDVRLWIYAAVGVCLCLATLLSLTQTQRDILSRRFRLRRRTPSADTPPRSLSPDKKVPSNAPPTTNEYIDTFPPSRREELIELAATLPPRQREALGDLGVDAPNVTKSMIGFEDDWRQCDGSKYTPTGFSVKEIRALGNFPDYAQLSGVPLPAPYHDFDIDKARARPYRPFRWSYHQTMSLTKLEPDWWLELENTYKERIAQRKQLYDEHGESVVQWLPGSELACKELMEVAIQFLCARYPHYFALSADKDHLTNKILGTTTSIRDKHPLLVMLDHVPEDFALMLRNPETGYYHFRAGMICSALGWNVGTKIGLRLHQIHEPIPDYKEKMQFSMDR